jgi:hypothetical protein
MVGLKLISLSVGLLCRRLGGKALIDRRAVAMAVDDLPLAVLAAG